MNRTIKRQISNLYKQTNVRKYSITHEGLHIIFKLKPRSQQLLKSMLGLLQNNCKYESLTLEISYYDMGFDDQSNFIKYRNELVKSRLIFFEGNKYFINPCYINFYSRRQTEWLFGLFSLTTVKPVVMTDPTKLRIAR